MKEWGMTQRQIENDLGVTHQTVSFWTSKYVFPQATMIIKICKTYGISADWLLGLSERRERE